MRWSNVSPNVSFCFETNISRIRLGRKTFCPGVRGTFLKMDEKYLDFAKESIQILEKITPFVCIDGSNSHLKCSFKSILEKKHQMLSLQGSLFVCHTWKLYWSAPILTILPCPVRSAKFLVALLRRLCFFSFYLFIIFFVLLTLYFAIRYSWQLWNSKKSLGHPYISRNLQISFTNIFFSFSLTNACLHCRLSNLHAVLWTAKRFVVSEISKHNAFDFIDENFETLNSISNIFQETHDFLVLTESVIICIYLRKVQRKGFSKKPPKDIWR